MIAELLKKKSLVKTKPKENEVEKPHRKIIDIENWVTESYKNKMKTTRSIFWGTEIFFQIFVVLPSAFSIIKENPYLFLFQQFLILAITLFWVWLYFLSGHKFPLKLKKHQLYIIASAKAQFPREENAVDFIGSRYSFKELFPERHKNDPYETAY